MEHIQRRGTRILKGLEANPYEKWLKEMSLGKRSSDRTAMFKYLQGCPLEGGAKLFPVVAEGGAQVQERRLCLNMKKNFL